MTTKNMAYDHAAYLARLPVNLGATTAGSGALTHKFVAFTAMQIYSLTAQVIATGSSTYASMWNGTATVPTAVGATTVSVLRLLNTAAPGATPALSTATYGPFVLSLYDGTSTNTQTNSSKPGFAINIPLYGTATTGTAQAGSAAASGGIAVNQGDVVWCVQGTDATFSASYGLEVGISPFANLTL